MNSNYYYNFIVFVYMFMLILMFALIAEVGMYLTKSRKDQRNDNTRRSNSTQN